MESNLIAQWVVGIGLQASRKGVRSRRKGMAGGMDSGQEGFWSAISKSKGSWNIRARIAELVGEQG